MGEWRSIRLALFRLACLKRFCTSTYYRSACHRPILPNPSTWLIRKWKENQTSRFYQVYQVCPGLSRSVRSVRSISCSASPAGKSLEHGSIGDRMMLPMQKPKRTSAPKTYDLQSYKVTRCTYKLPPPHTPPFYQLAIAFKKQSFSRSAPLKSLYLLLPCISLSTF